MSTYIREKKIECGKKHMEVDIYAISDKQLKKKRSRKKEVLSKPSQRNLNDKNARRYLKQLIKANFDEGDLHVSCTYKIKYQPSTIEEAEKEINKFIRRIQYRRKKNNQDPIKYIIITEKGKKNGKLHHHIIMSDMDRDQLEELWRKPRQKGQKKGEAIGWVNADRLRPDEDTGLSDISQYVSKEPQGKKRWRASQNLIKPMVSVADKKWTRRKLEQCAMIADEDRAFWAKKFPGWKMVTCESVFNEITGWSIYLELRRLE